MYMLSISPYIQIVMGIGSGNGGGWQCEHNGDRGGEQMVAVRVLFLLSSPIPIPSSSSQ